MLKIWGRKNSSNVRKALWCAEELGLDYEAIDAGGAFGVVDTPQYRALNPNGRVPVIQDGDFVLWESNSICRYLVRKNGHPTLLGGDLQQMATVEQWMDWQSTELNNSWRYAFMHLVRKSPAYADAAAAAHSIEAWNQKMHILDAALAKTALYITGAEFTLADIVLGLSVNRWLMTPMERPELPAVAAYYQKLSLRPGFQRFGCNGTP